MLLDYNVLAESYSEVLIEEVKNFEPLSQDLSVKVFTIWSHQTKFEHKIYDKGDSNIQPSEAQEIARYLSSESEKQGTDVLTYWQVNKKTWAVLAPIAKVYLAIPEISKLLKRAFIKNKAILGSQSTNLSAESVSQIFCLRDWLWTQGPPYGELFDLIDRHLVEWSFYPLH